MSEIDYLRRRLADENRMADQASCPEAELVHRTLAVRYARQALQEIQNGPDRGATFVVGNAVLAGNFRSEKVMPIYRVRKQLRHEKINAARDLVMRRSGEKDVPLHAVD